MVTLWLKEAIANLWSVEQKSSQAVHSGKECKLTRNPIVRRNWGCKDGRYGEKDSVLTRGGLVSGVSVVTMARSQQRS